MDFTNSQSTIAEGETSLVGLEINTSDSIAFRMSLVNGDPDGLTTFVDTVIAANNNNNLSVAIKIRDNTSFELPRFYEWVIEPLFPDTLTSEADVFTLNVLDNDTLFITIEEQAQIINEGSMANFQLSGSVFTEVPLNFKLANPGDTNQVQPLYSPSFQISDLPANIVVSAPQDDVYAGNRHHSLILQLDTPKNDHVFLVDSILTLEVRNDDFPEGFPVYNFRRNNITIEENALNVRLRVERQPLPFASSLTVTLDKNIDNIFQNTAQKISFGPQDTLKTVNFPFQKDELVRPDRKYQFFLLTDESNEVDTSFIGRNFRSEATILESDTTRVGFTNNSYLVSEEDSFASLFINVQNPFAYKGLKVNLRLFNGDSSDLGGFTEGIITIPQAETGPFEILIPVNNDTLSEGAEIFSFILEPLDRNVLGFSTASLTVIDDDATTVSFAFRSDSVQEMDGTYYLPVVIENPSTTENTTFSVSLISGDEQRLNNFFGFEGTFEASGNSQINIPLNLSDNDIADSKNPLIFGIENVEGGINASPGIIRRFTLVSIDNEEVVLGMVADSQIASEGALLPVKVYAKGKRALDISFTISSKDTIALLPSPLPVILSLTPEADTIQINFLLPDDNIFTGDIHYNLKLENIISDIQNVSIGADSTLMITMKENEQQPAEVFFTASGATIFESDETHEIAVAVRRNAIEDTISFNVFLKSGQANAIIGELKRFNFAPQDPDTSSFEIALINNDTANPTQEFIFGIEGGPNSLVLSSGAEYRLIVLDDESDLPGVTGENIIPGLEIYPNPVDQQLTVKYPGIFKITVFNSSGVVISETTSEYVLKKDLSTFAEGLYFITVEANGVILTQKIIVVK
mgnify:CR=1 FL=1